MLLLLACAPHPAAYTSTECRPDPADDTLAAGLAGLTVRYRRFDADCEEAATDEDGVELRHYDASERVDHRVGSALYETAEWIDTWASDTCASYSYSLQSSPGLTHEETETTRTCVDGWPASADNHHYGYSDSEWDFRTAETWTYTWADDGPATIDHRTTDSRELTTRTYDAGHVVVEETETDQGGWTVTVYDWEDDLLVSESVAGAFDGSTTTWTYDDEGRVRTWWTDAADPAETGTYTYVEGTRRPSSATIRAGDAESYVLYTWSDEG